MHSLTILTNLQWTTIPLDFVNVRPKWPGTWSQSREWITKTLCVSESFPTCSALRLNGSWLTNRLQHPPGDSIHSFQITHIPFTLLITSQIPTKSVSTHSTNNIKISQFFTTYSHIAPNRFSFLIKIDI